MHKTSALTAWPLLCALLLLTTQSLPAVEIIMDDAEASFGDSESNGVPILMYHGLSAEHGQDPALFVEQMEYLAENQFECITLDHLKSWIETGLPSLPPKPLIVTFDDNYITVYDTAYPTIKRLREETGAKLFGYNYAHTFYVGSVTTFDHADWNECVEMEDAGVLFTESHTVTHRDLTSLSAEELRTELKKSKEDIESVFERETRHLAYPYGTYNSQVIEMAIEEGYETAVSTEPGMNTRDTPLYELRRYNITPNMGTGLSFTDALENNATNSGWSNSTSIGGYYGPGYQVAAAGSGEAKMTWYFTVPTDGACSVSAWWTAWTNRATNTPYTIIHSGGSTTVRMNQTQNGSTWANLGTYEFLAGHSYAVTISNDADNFVIADAIRIATIETPATQMWAIH